MRYIDADTFEVFTYTKTESQPDTFDAGVQFVLEKIDATPTAEVEPVRHAYFVTELVTKEDWKGKPHQYYQPNSCSYCHTALSGKESYCSTCGSKMHREEN